MVKKIFILVIISTLFFSCEKDDDNKTEVSKNGIATITGKVKADLDLTELGLEYVPQGTVVLAKIHINDLVNINPQDSIDYGYKIFKTTVDSNGEYSVNVEANAFNVDVTIMGEDFEYNQKVNDTLIVRKIYTVAENYTTVVNGITKIIDLNYN